MYKNGIKTQVLQNRYFITEENSFILQLHNSRKTCQKIKKFSGAWHKSLAKDNFINTYDLLGGSFSLDD